MILYHPLSNFEIQKYYQNKPNFNSLYLRNNLSEINNAAYIINLNEYESTGSLWIAFYVNVKNVNKRQKIQAYDSIMCGYFCIGFIGFMLKDKSLLKFTNLFSPYEYDKMTK